MTDLELSVLIDMRSNENQDMAIRRYVYETNISLGSMLSRAKASEQELKRVRKLLKLALGCKVG